VGEGYTQPPGQAHAEIVAIRRAGDAARGIHAIRDPRPCCHHDAPRRVPTPIIALGVTEVHMAVLDPNPLVSGGRTAAWTRRDQNLRR